MVLQRERDALGNELLANLDMTPARLNMEGCMPQAPKPKRGIWLQMLLPQKANGTGNISSRCLVNSLANIPFRCQHGHVVGMFREQSLSRVLGCVEELQVAS